MRKTDLRKLAHDVLRDLNLPVHCAGRAHSERCTSIFVALLMTRRETFARCARLAGHALDNHARIAEAIKMPEYKRGPRAAADACLLLKKTFDTLRDETGARR